jgi:hypothetical protein
VSHDELVHGPRSRCAAAVRARGATKRLPAAALRTPEDPGLPPPLVDMADIVDGGQPPDGIPALDRPRFQRTGDVRWVDDTEQVLAVEVGGEARAYPVQVLTLHEVVNDTVAGIPVAVTYCPLCASALVFDRRVEGRVLSFGTSGRLYHSDLVMYDRQTESLWPQIEGRVVAGVLTGAELPVLAGSMVSWAQWRESHPQAWVLSRQTGHALSYGANPYYKYDDKESLPLFLTGPVDNRIEWLKQPVVGVRSGDAAVAIDVEALQRDRARDFALDGRAMTAWWFAGARSSLDEYAVGEGREVGTVAVFEPHLDGRRLTFRGEGDGVVDAQTGSQWNAFGTATAGPLRGRRFVPVPHVTTFWFAWRAMHAETDVLR